MHLSTLPTHANHWHFNRPMKMSRGLFLPLRYFWEVADTFPLISLIRTSSQSLSGGFQEEFWNSSNGICLSSSSTVISMAVQPGQGFTWNGFAKGENCRSTGLIQSYRPSVCIKRNQNFIHIPVSMRTHERWVFFPINFLAEGGLEGFVYSREAPNHNKLLRKLVLNVQTLSHLLNPLNLNHWSDVCK